MRRRAVTRTTAPTSPRPSPPPGAEREKPPLWPSMFALRPSGGRGNVGGTRRSFPSASPDHGAVHRARRPRQDRIELRERELVRRFRISYACARYPHHVMAGLVPAIHWVVHAPAVLAERDARNKSDGHDGARESGLGMATGGRMGGRSSTGRSLPAVRASVAATVEGSLGITPRVSVVSLIPVVPVIPFIPPNPVQSRLQFGPCAAHLPLSPSQLFKSLKRRALAPRAWLRAYARDAVAPSGPSAREGGEGTQAATAFSPSPPSGGGEGRGGGAGSRSPYQ